MTHPFIEHLLEDHQEQRSIASQLKAAEQSATRDDLRQKMSDELLPHMAGEEASIFAYMRASDSTEALEHALEAIQEHHVARLVLKELMELQPESDVFAAKAFVLSEINEHHMKEEEAQHFPWIEKNASSDQLGELFEQYKVAEKQAKRA